MIKFLWSSYWNLPWWADILIFAYAIYFIVRSVMIYVATKDNGIPKGYKLIFLGRNPEYLRLYHVLRMIIDIPPLTVGIFFPFIRFVFTLKLVKLKKEPNIV